MVKLIRNRRRTRAYDLAESDNLDEVVAALDLGVTAAQETATAAQEAVAGATEAAEAALSAAEAARARGNHTGQQAAATISDFAAAAADVVNATLIQGTNVTLTWNGGARTLTIDATGGGGGASPALGWVI